ncbi:CPBP family intramembrane glutamic endopeptidase [Nocardia terpenica]|uniref:CPBP family intramembrane metalloprotease n=1 Tax=Nocardia terpenica TaxID=455432 RepID=A0A6G9YW85_9NOCA|nr:CPBP family intramembrane glutamic endopeptidase [Nocardia terpenica]QIS17472.1 CPBP family intramembrane metalloprotease [Nocardia terpenica]
MRGRDAAAEVVVATALPLLWSNLLLPRLRLGMRGRTAATTAFATAYGLAFRARPHWHSPRGLATGLLAATTITAGYAAALALPPLRTKLAEFAARTPEVTPTEWVTLHIPLGTVYSEELIFRATLDPLLSRTTGRYAKFLAPMAFGLWHITPARSAGDNPAIAVAATTLGGAILSHLRRRADNSTTAPALLHLALNAGGVLTPRLARRGSMDREACRNVRAGR